MYLRRLVTVLRKAGGAWVDDRAQSMGAALSYYTVFSIAPLLLIAISVAGLVFGEKAAQGQVPTPVIPLEDKPWPHHRM